MRRPSAPAMLRACRHGAMGLVVRAFDPANGKDVAIKVLAAGGAGAGLAQTPDDGNPGARPAPPAKQD
ncbi:MAG: hypothetical protein M9894_03770 [Planctomycetes bacterium]|nr:hypothetical protein [Planctomycetota bacterium]